MNYLIIGFKRKKMFKDIAYSHYEMEIRKYAMSILTKNVTVIRFKNFNTLLYVYRHIIMSM